MAGGLGPKDDDSYALKGPVDWGIWESKGYYDNPELMGGDGESAIVSGGGGEYCPVGGATPKERAANAQLIAAAPTMAQLLQEAISAWSEFDCPPNELPTVSGADLIEWFDTWRAKAKALLNGDMQ